MEAPVLTLRVATLADAPRIDALMKASAAAIFPAFYDATQTASAVRYVAQVDPDLLVDGTYFVIEDGGEVVACGGWSRRGRVYMGSANAPGDDRFLDPATEAAHIRAMFVRADWTRRGLGRRIIEASEDAARRMGFRRMDLVATLPGDPAVPGRRLRADRGGRGHRPRRRCAAALPGDDQATRRRRGMTTLEAPRAADDGSRTTRATRCCSGRRPIQKLERLTKHLGGATLWAKREDCNSALRVRREQGAQARVPRRRRAGAGLRHARVDRWRPVEPHPPGRGRGRRGRPEVRARPGELGRLARRHLRPRRQHPAVAADGRRRAAREGRLRDRVQGELGAGARGDRGAGGGKPYAIPAGASDHPLGGLGFASWAREVEAQERELGVFFDTIIVCSVTGSTQAGMIAGFADPADGRGAAGPRHRRLRQAGRDARPGRPDRAVHGGRDRPRARPARRRDHPRRPLPRRHLRHPGRPDARRDAARRPPRGDDHRPGLRGKVDGRDDRPRQPRRDRAVIERAVCAPRWAAGDQRVRGAVQLGHALDCCRYAAAAAKNWR